MSEIERNKYGRLVIAGDDSVIFEDYGITVYAHKGTLEISASDGELVIKPRAANSAYVEFTNR